jgi:predicted glycosyltransferase
MENEIKNKTGNRAKFKKIVKEYKNATTSEIWEGVRDNFTFGFIGATIVVFIATRADFAVLLGYLAYYFFMGKIVNRPKYVTDLGRMIVFPIPSTLGAFTGYKLSYYFLQIIS